MLAFWNCHHKTGTVEPLKLVRLINVIKAAYLPVPWSESSSVSVWCSSLEASSYKLESSVPISLDKGISRPSSLLLSVFNYSTVVESLSFPTSFEVCFKNFCFSSTNWLRRRRFSSSNLWQFRQCIPVDIVWVNASSTVVTLQGILNTSSYKTFKSHNFKL